MMNRLIFSSFAASPFDDLDDIYDVIQRIAEAAGSMYVLLVLGGLVFLFLLYLFHGYMVNCIGRKAGIPEEKGWMCYVPIARELYMTSITQAPGWYVLFLEGLLNSLLYFAVFMLFLAILGTVGLMKHLLLLMLVFLAIWIASCVFRFLYYKEFYKDFGFNPNTAIANILPTVNTIPALPFCLAISWVLFALIAFYDKIIYKESPAAARAYQGNATPAPAQQQAPAYTPPQVPKGRAFVTGMSGKYMGATFDLDAGTQIVFGRSAGEANVIFDQFDTDISRKHCVLQYNAAAGQYVLTDLSTNGTYGPGNVRYPANQPVNLAPGTVIYLGKTRKHSFRVG